MKQLWNEEELGQYWALTFEELELLNKKQTKSYLSFCLQLLYYRNNGDFPERFNSFPDTVIEYVADQLSVNKVTLKEHRWDKRKSQRHKKEILEFLGITKITEQNKQVLHNWLKLDIFPKGATISEALEYVMEWLHCNKILRPAVFQIEKLIATAYNQFEKELFINIRDSLSSESKHLVDYCLEEKGETISFSVLKSDPGRISLDSVLKEIEKLDFINQLDLQYEHFYSLSSKIVSRYRLRSLSETAWEVRRHPEHIRYTLKIY